MTPLGAAGRAFALVLLLGLAAPAAGEEVLTPDQARAVALTASVRGDYRLAYDLGETLLERDPNDVPALLAVSRSAPHVGRAARGIEAGKRAFALAPNRLQKFNAAYMIAQAEFAAGHPIRSQIWLRRASSLATNDRQSVAVAGAYRKVRAISPLNLQISFGVRPTSNANGGSAASEISYGGLVFGLSGAAQALPGIEAAGGMSFTYTLDGNQKRSTRLLLSAYARTYKLTPAALAAAPGASGSDYAYLQGQIGVLHDRRVGEKGAMSFALIGAHAIYGGEALMNSLALRTGYFHDLDDRTRLNLTFSAERQWRLDEALRSANLFSLGLGGTRKLANGNSVKAEVSLGHVTSQSATVANDRIGVSMGYDFARPVAGIRFGLTAGAGWRHYPQSVFVAGSRDDTELNLGVKMVLTRISYWGFSPELELGYSKVMSSDDLFDRNDLGLRLGLQSKF